MFLVAIIALIAIAQAQDDARRQQYGSISAAYRRDVNNFARTHRNTYALRRNQWLTAVGSKNSGIETLPQGLQNHLRSRNFAGRARFRAERRDQDLINRQTDRKNLEEFVGDRDAMRARFLRNSIGFAGVRGQAPMSFEQRLASARGARMEREIIRAEADIPN